MSIHDLHPIGDSVFHHNGDDANMNQLPNRIRKLREAKGLSMQQLADAVGTSQQQIQRLEYGQRRLSEDWMRKIGRVLGVHPAQLFIDWSLSHEQQRLKRIDDVLLLEWWHSLTLDKQMAWIGRFTSEARKASSTDHPKKRQA